MAKRLGAGGWLLGGVLCVLFLVTADYVHSALTERKPGAPAPPPSLYLPEFGEGKPAPDFALPDRHGRLHRLSEVEGTDFLVTFVHDDNASRALLHYAAQLSAARRKLGCPATVFVTVADFAPSQEDAFVSATGAKQLVLYEKPSGPVERQYRAPIRPRCYQLVDHLGCAVIGGSLAEHSLYDLGMEIRQGWRFRSPALTGVEFDPPKPEELKRIDAAHGMAAPR